MKIKILFLIIIILFISGCSKTNEKMAENLANKIIEAHYIESVNFSGLNKEEKQLLKTFLNAQKRQNKIINISNIIIFSPESYTEQNNTLGLYEKGNKLFIKYTDLIWEKVYNDEKAVINYNHMQTALFKSLVPILYEETKNNPKYVYELVHHENNLNNITYYYKSVYDNSGLVINFNISFNSLTDIEMYYQDIAFYEED